MPTWYLDQEGGNDANAGTSFATRKKTLQSIAAAGWAAGDAVRVMASPLPTALGVNGTWTQGSNAMTLSAAVTKNVDLCESGWVASANVTGTHPTTPRRQGSNSVQLAIASAFTTGLVAYKALGSAQDFSAFRQICLWFYSNGSVTAGQFEVRLCSDAAGVTAVNTIALPANPGFTWIRVVVDTGGALGASIQSVAVYAMSDPGTRTINLDNIFTSKAPGAADELTLFSLIGKNNTSPTSDEPFLPISVVNETTVGFSSASDESSSTPRSPKYRLASETTAAYVIQPIAISTQLTYSTAPTGDTNANPITIEGGWNRTDMSTKTWRTFMRRDVRASSVVVAAGAHGIIWRSLSACYAENSTTAGFAVRSVRGTLLDDCEAHSCYHGYRYAGDLTWVNFNNFSSYFCYNSVTFLNTVGNGSPPVKIKVKEWWGVGTGSYGFYISCNDTNERLWFAELDGGCIYNMEYSVYAGAGEGCARVSVRNIDFDSTIANDFYGRIRLNLWNTKHDSSTILGSAFANVGGRKVTLAGSVVDGVFRRFPYLTSGGNSLVTATDQRRTASDVSWKFSGATTSYPLSTARMCSVLCKANISRTVTVWARRDNTGNSLGRIRVPGGLYAGISADVTAVTSGLANTWEQLSISFTTTEDCVVDVFMEQEITTGATRSLWFDDVGVS
jgi:hypothetical protein